MAEWAVTTPGPQKARCVVDTCDRPPAGPGEVYCTGHLKLMGEVGNATTPPISEPDDPDLLERERRKAEVQERREYEERRRVKEWETLPNGTRRPKEYYTAEELAALDAEEEQQVAQLAERIRHLPTNRLPGDVMEHYEQMLEWQTRPSAALDPPEDPTKAQAKLFRKALKGKLGPVAEHTARMCLYVLENQDG